MRWRLAFVAALLFVAVLFAAAKGIANRSEPSTGSPTQWTADEVQDRFVVHEWGTFTSFSGSDSVKLEFRPLQDVDLPPFVLDRARQSGLFSLLGKRNINVRQRMETPVTYFYTDRPRQVRARVDFPHGLLTEFYPPVATMQPGFSLQKEEPLSNSALDWGPMWVVPENCLRADVTNADVSKQLHRRMLAAMLPDSQGNDHYAAARKTDSALVYVERRADARQPGAPRGGFFEKFLFYRGLGNFELPLALSAQSDGRFELHNTSPEPIKSMFLVTVAGNQLYFVKYDGIKPGGRLLLTQSHDASSVEALAQAVTTALVEERLYEKEARAMVETWKSSWFGEQGTRLFYMLPETVTNKLLPLDIDPQPDELVRVMVGRLEIMTPEDETRVTNLVAESAQARAATAEQKSADGTPTRHALPKEIIALGRLAEPALVRIKHIAKDENVRGEAGLLLYQLNVHRNSQSGDPAD